MTRSQAIWMAAALLAVAAPAWAQSPPTSFFLAYARTAGSTPRCDLAPVDPADHQGGNPANFPVLPPFDMPEVGSVDLDLCMMVWPPVDSDTEVEDVCHDASGTEICAVRLTFSANGGMTITSFTDAPPVGPAPPAPAPPLPAFKSHIVGNQVTVVGGDPVNGQQALGTEGIFVGTISLAGLSANAVLELQSGSYVTADMRRLATATPVVAASLQTCGNALLDAGEYCDDGNALFGDGCTPTCEQESGFGLTGRAGLSGSLAFTVDAVPVVLDLATTPNAPAEEVVQAAVARVNQSQAISAVAAQVDDPVADPDDDGRRLATNGTLDPVVTIVNDAQGTLALSAPEPGQGLLLATGLLALARLARASRHRRSG